MISAPLGCGFAAFRAESLRLSVTSLQKERLRLGRRSRQTGQGLTESQRLSAREAAKLKTNLGEMIFPARVTTQSSNSYHQADVTQG